MIEHDRVAAHTCKWQSPHPTIRACTALYYPGASRTRCNGSGPVMILALCGPCAQRLCPCRQSTCRERIYKSKEDPNRGQKMREHYTQDTKALHPHHVVGFTSSDSKAPVVPRKTWLPTLNRSRMLCSSTTMVSVNLELNSQCIKANLKQLLPMPGVPV